MNEEMKKTHGDIMEYLLTAELPENEEKEVNIAGFPFPFKIRAISEKENTELRKKAIKKELNPKTRQMETKTDNEAYTKSLVIASCVSPNFKNAELQAKFGVVGEVECLNKILKAGQYLKLIEEVQEINGFTDNLTDEVKN